MRYSGHVVNSEITHAAHGNGMGKFSRGQNRKVEGCRRL
jgi:hypothetical protein